MCEMATLNVWLTCELRTKAIAILKRMIEQKRVAIPFDDLKHRDKSNENGREREWDEKGKKTHESNFALNKLNN